MTGSRIIDILVYSMIHFACLDRFSSKGMLNRAIKYDILHFA